MSIREGRRLLEAVALRLRREHRIKDAVEIEAIIAEHLYRHRRRPRARAMTPELHEQIVSFAANFPALPQDVIGRYFGTAGEGVAQAVTVGRSVKLPGRKDIDPVTHTP